MAELRPAARSPLDHIGSFRVVYLGILAYVVLAIGSVQATQALLDRHFRAAVHEAVSVSPAHARIVPQIQQAVSEIVRGSAWVRFGGVRLNALVLGADGRTPIYLEGRTIAPPPDLGRDTAFTEADQLLPAISEVTVLVPFGSLLAGAIFVGWGAAFVPWLFGVYARRLRRDAALVEDAVTARDAAAERARSIQTELEKVRARLLRIEPAERAQGEAISGLHQERERLQAKLREISEREVQLREELSRTSELERERQALEDLLEEAVQDLGQKEREIETLEDRLRHAARAPAVSRRSAEQIGKRLRALYPNLEIDDRALDDMAGLGDESLRLRAEEVLKRLDADAGQAPVRRKVGGLPPGLAIFELGFAGKGRIYFCRGRQRPHRILALGGKASQRVDLEYLSRLSLD
jgi:hypothetical protein